MAQPIAIAQFPKRKGRFPKISGNLQALADPSLVDHLVLTMGQDPEANSGMAVEEPTAGELAIPVHHID